MRPRTSDTLLIAFVATLAVACNGSNRPVPHHSDAGFHPGRADATPSVDAQTPDAAVVTHVPPAHCTPVDADAGAGPWIYVRILGIAQRVLSAASASRPVVAYGAQPIPPYPMPATAAGDCFAIASAADGQDLYGTVAEECYGTSRLVLGSRERQEHTTPDRPYDVRLVPTVQGNPPHVCVNESGPDIGYPIPVYQLPDRERPDRLRQTSAVIATAPLPARSAELQRRLDGQGVTRDQFITMIGGDDPFRDLVPIEPVGPPHVNDQGVALPATPPNMHAIPRPRVHATPPPP